jgi:hypothetical protein
MFSQISKIDRIALSIFEGSNIAQNGVLTYSSLSTDSTNEIFPVFAKFNNFAIWDKGHVAQFPFVVLLIVVHYTEFFLTSAKVIVVVILDHAEAFHLTKHVHILAECLLISKVHFLNFELENILKVLWVHLSPIRRFSLAKFLEI